MDYEPKRAHYYKYHEEEILKDIEEYVSQPTKDTIQEQNMSSVKYKLST